MTQTHVDFKGWPVCGRVLHRLEEGVALVADPDFLLLAACHRHLFL